MTQTCPKFIQILPLPPTTLLLSWVPVILCQLVVATYYTTKIRPIFTHLSCNICMNITEAIIMASFKVFFFLILKL